MEQEYYSNDSINWRLRRDRRRGLCQPRTPACACRKIFSIPVLKVSLILALQQILRGNYYPLFPYYKFAQQTNY